MKRRHRIETHSIPLFLLLHFVLAFLLLMLTQGLFAWVNRGYFAAASGGEVVRLLVGNVHFGLSGTAMALLPLVLLMCVPVRARYRKGYQRAARIVAGVGVGFLLAANIADTAYFPWVLRRSAGDIFSYLGQNFEGQPLLGQMVCDFWGYLLLFFALMAAWIWVQRGICLKERHSGRRWPIVLVESLLTLLVCLTAMRGGWIVQHKPLAPVDASRYADQSNQALVLNTPFSILRTMGNSAHLTRCNFFADEADLETHFSPLCLPQSEGAQWERQPNVVIVLLEGFSEEYMGCINQGGTSYTPFLDSLSEHCLLFAGRANGKRSIESLPALFLGLPHLMDEAFITSPYSQCRTLSLPQILHRHGYASAFFHGAYNGSMNFDGFCQMIGFDHYYGMDQYPDKADFDGTWGIFDEPFLLFAARQMAAMPQPFFATVYTISSHHPYSIPPHYEGRFPQGEIPLLETIGYTDHALRRFFDEARRQPWYANTLFVITADHASQPLSPYYRQHPYNVPMMLFHPSGLDSIEGRPLFQHSDLMPTLIDLLGLPDTCLAFGHSALRGEGFHIAYPGPTYRLERRGRVVAFDGKQTLPANAPKEDALFLQALIQQYNNRLLDNRLMPTQKTNK